MKWKQLLSYIWPISKRYNTSRNGTLEVTWFFGKKLLYSENSNYSYGPLQDLLEFGLDQLPINTGSDVLLLGLGAGSILRPLRGKYGVEGQITAVEFDPDMIGLAHDEFDIGDVEQVEIVEREAHDFLKNCSSHYDLIIVDLFIDDMVPDEIYSIGFWERIRSVSNPGAQFVFNAGINLADRELLNRLLEHLQVVADFSRFEGINGTNTVIVGKFFTLK